MSELELACNVITTLNTDSDLNIPASVYLKCDQFYYQIAVMYPRGDFFWIPKDDFYIEGVSKSFGDLNRALNK